MQSASRPIALETRRNLRNPRFENYVLNIKGIASVSRFPLPRSYGFDKVSSSSTLPLRKLRIRGRFNHLVTNPYRPDAIQYIDETYTLQYGIIPSQEDAPPQFTPLYRLNVPSSTSSDCREYPTAIFASNSDIIASNGFNQLVWLRLSTNAVSIASTIPFNTSTPPIVLAARQTQQNHVRAVILTMEEKPRENTSTTSEPRRMPESKIKVLFTLSLLDLRLDANGICKCEAVMAAQGDTAPYFVHLDENGAFIVVSEMNYEMIKSSASSDIRDAEGDEKKSASNYQWFQTPDEVIITLVLPSSIPPSQIVCNFTPARVTISTKSPHPSPHVILNKPFFDTIIPSDSIWTLESNKILTLNIAKNMNSGSFAGSRWPQLFKGGDDDGVNESIDPSEASMMFEPMEKFTTDDGWGGGMESETSVLQNQIGEVPEPEDYKATKATIVKFSSSGGIEKCDTNGYEWIGHSSTTMLLKRDVDGLIFDTTFQHVATFPALAYIAASKRLKRFVIYPDTINKYEFVAVIESRRVIYIYRPNGGSVDVNRGEQNLVDLAEGDNEEGEILGACVVSGTKLCLLTDRNLIVVSLRM